MFCLYCRSLISNLSPVININVCDIIALKLCNQHFFYSYDIKCNHMWQFLLIFFISSIGPPIKYWNFPNTLKK